MDNTKTLTEQWATQAQVQQLLNDILSSPFADYSDAILEALDGVVFSAVHAVALLRASNRISKRLMRHTRTHHHFHSKSVPQVPARGTLTAESRW